VVDGAQHRDADVRSEPVAGAPTDDAFEAALARLDELAATPIRDHVAVFEAIHESLQDRLADRGE
jgi:hypothetical protein